MRRCQLLLQGLDLGLGLQRLQLGALDAGRRLAQLAFQLGPLGQTRGQLSLGTGQFFAQAGSRVAGVGVRRCQLLFQCRDLGSAFLGLPVGQLQGSGPVQNLRLQLVPLRVGLRQLSLGLEQLFGLAIQLRLHINDLIASGCLRQRQLIGQGGNLAGMAAGLCFKLLLG